MKTTVIFRKWNNGQIIAIFPEIPADHCYGHCMSYEHIGQHGTCAPGYVIHATTQASEAEALPIRKELESIGYELQVRLRYCESMQQRRFSEMRVEQ